MRSYTVLAINPGSTSTKVALYSGATCLRQENLAHTAEELKTYPAVTDQYDFRLAAVKAFVASLGGIAIDGLVGRGGLLHPLTSGTYAVNDMMLADLKLGAQGEHASNLGGLLAHGLAREYGVPAFIVDPVAVDEMHDIARISGHPAIVRRSLFHALNVKAVARRVAKELGKPLETLNLVMAHLGGGISIVALRGGRAVDVNNANEMGPFSPERTGTLPAGDLAELCFNGRFTAGELRRELTGRGGLVAYLGTSDAREAYARADAGDNQAMITMAAMAYQIGKEIGAMATVMSGKVDAIVLTGGLAHSPRLTEDIAQYVDFIAPVLVHAGEDEMLALCEGAQRVLAGEEHALKYLGKH